MDKKQKAKLGILLQILIAFFIVGSTLILCTFFIIKDGMNSIEDSLVSEHLDTDLSYINEIIGGYCDPNYDRSNEFTWELQNNNELYCFGTYITSIEDSKVEGDKPADSSVLCKRMIDSSRSGITSYILIRDNNKEVNEEEGHYIRALGSTKGNNGESIVGTYIARNVSDTLDKGENFYGDANVLGRPMYCIYQPIKNASGEIIGSVVVGRNTADMHGIMKKSLVRTELLIWGFVLASLVGLMFFISKSVKNIKQINAYLNVIASGEFPKEPLKIKSKSELIEVCDSVNMMTKSLKEKERIGAELNVATSIQANMLPTIFPPFPEHQEFDIYASMEPAKEVGGDFYDFFMIDDSHVAVVIADVSGKGVPAALFMVTAKTLIKDHAQLGLEPYEVFTRVNSILCAGNKEGLFVTGWMGILDVSTGRLTYVNAGHNPPLLCTNGKYEYLKMRPGFVLAGIDGVTYRQNEVYMKPGDRLFLYTDGVTEATNLDNKLYGEDRLINFLNSHLDLNIHDACIQLRDDMDIFVGKAEQFDDITMLTLEIKQPIDRGFVDKVFEAKDENLSAAMAFIEEEMEKAEISPKIQMQISVAFEELFVNVCHYAYGSRTGDVKISMSTRDNKVTIKFKDSGIPFNPLDHIDPDINLSAQERKIGGLGIFMVKKTMDDVSYDYRDEMNILTIVKNY